MDKMNNTLNNSKSSSVDLAPLISLVAVLEINLSSLVLDIFLLVVFIVSASLQTLDNSFVINLVVSDLLFGFGCLGYSILLNLFPEDKDYATQACMVTYIVTGYLITAQIAALVWLTLDRFMKIVYPFTYNRICNKRNVVLILTLQHILLPPAQVIATMRIYQWDGEHYCVYYYISSTESLMCLCALMLCLLLCLLCLNVKILLVARHQQRAITAQAVSSETMQAPDTKSIGKVLAILTLFSFVLYIPCLLYGGLLVAGVQISETISDVVAFGTISLWNSKLSCGCTYFPCMQERH